MAFLDNSGDIILDAVLTDTGRYRLAKGDGSFKIVKFALGDDEIDYSLYDKENPGGSVYYDLNILQTPILEALTDNASALKSHLLTINRTDLLYLPVIRIFDVAGTGAETFDSAKKYYVVVADKTTEDKLPFGNPSDSTVKAPPGSFFTATPSRTNNHKVELHQGIDSESFLTPLPSELVESMFMIEMDKRFGVLKSIENNNTLVDISPSYIDDDQIATYLITQQRNSTMVSSIGTDEESTIAGSRGNRLKFSLGAALELQTSTYLFEELGFEITQSSNVFHVLDSTIRVTGATTGYRIDIPVRFYKFKQAV